MARRGERGRVDTAGVSREMLTSSWALSSELETES